LGRGIEGEGDRIQRKNVILAKNLRKNSTELEAILWSRLRAGRLEGYKFRRQHPMGDYVVDFVCPDKWVVVEIDGSQHQERKDADKIRDAFLRERGYRVLRFWNNDVLQNIEGVIDRIEQHVLGV
jgi:very-short-patch-repair endonuclease